MASPSPTRRTRAGHRDRFGCFEGPRAKKVGFRGFLQLSLPIPTLFPIKMQKPVSVGCFGGLWRGFNTKLCLEGVREGGPGGGKRGVQGFSPYGQP